MDLLSDKDRDGVIPVLKSFFNSVFINNCYLVTY